MEDRTISTTSDDRQSSTYRVDDVLDFEVRSARVVDVGTSQPDLIVRLSDGPQPNEMRIPLDHPGVTITRVVPGWWPPRPGQLMRFRDQGGVLVATRWVVSQDDDLWVVDVANFQCHAETAVRRHIATGGSVELIDLIPARITLTDPAAQAAEDVAAISAAVRAAAEDVAAISAAVRAAVDEAVCGTCLQPGHIPADHCGHTGPFDVLHAWVPDRQRPDADGYVEYEACGRLPGHDVHQVEATAAQDGGDQ